MHVYEYMCIFWVGELHILLSEGAIYKYILKSICMHFAIRRSAFQSHAIELNIRDKRNFPAMISKAKRSV